MINLVKYLIYICVGLCLFLYGMISSEYHLFPYPQLLYTKHFIYKYNYNYDIFIEYPYWKDRTGLFTSLNTTAKNVMIGDSITDNAEWHEIFPNASIVNRGISSDTTSGVLKRLDSVISVNPDVAFIMIGINDITRGLPVNNIYNNYINIIAKLRSHNIIPIIESTLFVSDQFQSDQLVNNNVNRDVEELNRRLLQYAIKENIVYIDLNADLSINNTLKKEFTNDGLHINGNGYQIWKIRIAKYVK